MESMARYFVIGGVFMILIGGGIYIFSKFGIPLGHLPGDIYIKGQNGSFYFPLTSCIFISVILTIILNIIFRFLHK